MKAMGDGGNRTHTSLRTQVFETCASTSSATSPCVLDRED